MNHPLHIVCLDAPSPPDYGGAIDMYYTVRALAEAGRKIHLHYFHYRSQRGVAGLEKYCATVSAYRRKTGWKGLSFSLPYIVSSRVSGELADRLNEDDYPILLEGIHCMGIRPLLKNKNRKVCVRLHNEEAVYYRQLAKGEKNFLKKAYYLLESRQLHSFQKKMDPTLSYACLSASDTAIFKQQYGLSNIHFLPVFVPWQAVTSMEGKGSYCLYQGNLSVAENEQAVRWLVQEVFSKGNIPFVIAGKRGSQRLQQLILPYRHISLLEDPSEETMRQLVRDAHIHVLPSLNKTGVKLKLLHALFEGRFCLSNAAGTRGSGVENAVMLAEDAATFRQAIGQLFEQPFTKNEREKRTALLSLYHNSLNAEKLSALL